MAIKEQAYRAHTFLKARGVSSLKRSHIHELLAAAVGYATYAAFQHEATWCEVPFRLADIECDRILLLTRCTELDLPPEQCRELVEALPKFQHDVGFAPVRF